MKEFTIAFLGFVTCMLFAFNIHDEKRITTLEKQMATVTDTVHQQVEINRGIIHALGLSQDPDYLRMITTRKLGDLRKQKKKAKFIPEEESK